MDSSILIVATIMVGCLSVAALGYALLSPSLTSREQTTRRVKTIAQRENSRLSGKGDSKDKAKDKRKIVQEKLDAIEAKKKENSQRFSLQDLISQAGLSITVTKFYLISLGFGTMTGTFAFFSGYSPITVAAITFVSLVGIPRWVIKFLANRRKKAFLREFANAIDIIVRGVKSGLPLNECLQIIASESPDPVGIEFREVVDNQRMGMPIDQCLEKLFERVPVAEVNFFSIVLSIQQSTGGNLSETLSNLSRVLRDRRMLGEKIKAMSSEAKASAMIIGSLPPLVALIVSIITPGYLDPLFEEKVGNMMLVGCGIWMGSGVFIMKKMINFKH